MGITTSLSGALGGPGAHRGQRGHSLAKEVIGAPNSHSLGVIPFSRSILQQMSRSPSGHSGHSPRWEAPLLLSQPELEPAGPWGPKRNSPFPSCPPLM
eukprot:scaffold184861_cov17-Tisochrysis_lutea.AAC.1